MEDRKKSKGVSWIIRILVFLGLVILSFAAYSVSKVVSRKNQVEKEISALKEEAEKISRENGDLKDKLSYFESRDFQEKEVRDKLSLQSPDENLVVVKPGPSGEKQENPVSDVAENNSSENTPIYKKWWDYFFKY